MGQATSRGALLPATWGFGLLSLFVSACAGTPPSTADPGLETLSTISLDHTVHFLASDGTLLPLQPGEYTVAAEQDRLRLSSPDGRSNVVMASSTTHEEAVTRPVSLSFAGEDGESVDLHHIILLLPGGYSLDAVGTYSGVTSRGLKDRLAQRPLIQKAIQAKVAIQAHVHGRLFGAPPPHSLGPNAFHTVFNEQAIGYAPGNTYLLTYLSTLIYPDFLDQLSGDPLQQNVEYVTRLHKTPQAFVEEYARYTHHLFWDPAAPPGPANSPPQYAWVWGNRGGQDPEAMVIATEQAVFVVFRGTDRVGAAKRPVGYDWAEWVHTNFVALGIAPDVAPLRGLVHAGFWASLTAPAGVYVPEQAHRPAGIADGLPFRDATLAVVRAFGGTHKKVWITGHSLGAAHAQLYSAYLAVKGLTPQGVNAVAAPHVGDQTFVDQLNAMFPDRRLQRLDFVHDPVTKVPPNAPLPQKPGTPPITFARAGTRVYYDDVKTIQVGAPERSPAEAVRIATLLVGTPLTRVFAAGDFCYHYPHWHLNAAYGQLSPTMAKQVPSPLLTPVMRGDIYTRICGPPQITRGNVRPGAALGTILPGR